MAFSVSQRCYALATDGVTLHDTVVQRSRKEIVRRAYLGVGVEESSAAE